MKNLTKKCNKRLWAILIAIALIFSNAGVSLAAESTDNSIVATAFNDTDKADDGIAVISDDNFTVPEAFEKEKPVPDVSEPTSYTQVYNRIMAWKAILPEGMDWSDYTPYNRNTNNGYIWKGGKIDGKNMINFGCAAFACILSDVAFGNLPAKTIYTDQIKFEQIHVGDILRVNGNSHSVIVLEIYDQGIVVAEGNYSGKVHWGRSISKEDVLYADFLVTRYPDNFISTDQVDATTIVAEGEVEGIGWKLNQTRNLTISGSGKIPDNFLEKMIEKYPDYDLKDSVGSIIIESGITSIGNKAFSESSARNVKFPNSVTEIGDESFYSSKLIGVEILGNVETIGSKAFMNCADLSSLTLDEGVTSIGESAFRGCNNISNLVLTIPSTVTSVGASAFMSCANLISVKFESSNNEVTIGDDAFLQCWKMLSITLPQNLKNIPNGMLYDCFMLGYLYIPETVQSISEDLSDPPFKNMGKNILLSGVSVEINFGGSEEKWNDIGVWALNYSYQGYNSKPTVTCNVPPTTTPSNPEEPSSEPTETPTIEPSSAPEETPTATPSSEPTETPTTEPSSTPTENPTATPSSEPTSKPTVKPSTSTGISTLKPSSEPIATPTVKPSSTPTATQTVEASSAPTETPMVVSSSAPIENPTIKPSVTTKPSPSPKVTYANKQKKDGVYTYLYNSKNKKVDKFKVKNGKLTYKGKKIKNWKDVKWADFNKVGNIIAVRKNGKYYSVNHKTLKVKKLGKKAKSRVKKNGLITHIIKKSGKKKNVAKK